METTPILYQCAVCSVFNVLNPCTTCDVCCFLTVDVRDEDALLELKNAEIAQLKGKIARLEAEMSLLKKKARRGKTSRPDNADRHFLSFEKKGAGLSVKNHGVMSRLLMPAGSWFCGLCKHGTLALCASHSYARHAHGLQWSRASRGVLRAREALHLLRAEPHISEQILGRSPHGCPRASRCDGAAGHPL